MLTPSCLWFLLPVGPVLKPHAGLSACDGTGPSRWYPGSTFTKAPHPVLISALSHEIIPASGIRRRRVRSRREKTAHSHPKSHRPGTQACGWPGSLWQEWGTKPRQSWALRITPPPSLSWSPGCCRLQLPLERKACGSESERPGQGQALG